MKRPFPPIGPGHVFPPPPEPPRALNPEKLRSVDVNRKYGTPAYGPGRHTAHTTASVAASPPSTAASATAKLSVEPQAPAKAPSASVTRHPGGKDPEHAWESAADHVDEVARKGPLPRNKRGEPIVQRAIDLMKDYFEAKEPATPRDRSIRRWIKDNPARTRRWW
jgi:hypothetical protein